MAGPERFFFGVEGRDEQALIEGVAWLGKQAAGDRGIVVVPTLAQVEWLTPGLTPVEAQRLKKDKRIRHGMATFELLTERTSAGSSVQGAAVLGVWVDDEQLESIERRHPSALCVVPWLRADIRRWREAYGPTDMRSGTPAHTQSAVSNPVVEQALKSLTARVNLSTGLGHPSDKAAAVGAFRVLLAAGERYDPDEVAAWAASNGWGMAGARELSEIARGVIAGKRYRVEPSGWREDVLELWRREAEKESDGDE